MCLSELKKALSYRLEISLALTEQEHILVPLGWPIAHTLRHTATAVGGAEGKALGPDYFAPQVPTIGLEGKGHAPGDAAEIFGFEVCDFRI